MAEPSEPLVRAHGWGVTGYDVYANDVLLGSVAGDVLTYTDTQPASATVSPAARTIMYRVLICYSSAL